MEVIVPILLTVIGGLLIALVIIGEMYNELKDDYRELLHLYFTDTDEEDY